MTITYDPGLNAPVIPSNASAVSWSAIFAGAAAAAVLSLILLILGVGLGLSSISPWAQSGVSAVTFGISTIVWLGCSQLIASAMGGYLAGRLRTRWPGVDTDEVYFRDTAHGFLAWAVASLTTAILLTSAVASIVGAGVSASASVVGGATAHSNVSNVNNVSNNGVNDGVISNAMGGLLEGLFRKNITGTTPTTAPATGSGTANSTAAPTPMTSAVSEVSQIYLRSMNAGALQPADVTYLGQLVAQRTDLSQQDAEKRVTDTFTVAKTRLQEAKTAAKEAADKARKASATAALWLFVSLLMGAFSASFAAIYGGRQRDL